MTMNPEYLKYCRYYKGEETIPLEKSYDKFTRFWLLERDYYSSEYESKHEYWETEGQMWCTPFIKNYLSKIKDKTVVGFIVWATTMVSYNSPMESGSFILRYKYDNTDESDEANTNSNMFSDLMGDSKSNNLYQCLYYNGEEECPYDLKTIQSTFWRIEKIWDIIVRDDEIERSNKESEFLVDFPDAIEDVESVPVSLKATLYDQFCRFGGDKYGFKDYLNEYLTNTPKK